MNTKVFQNAKWIIMCQVLQMLLGLVISMFSARYLGPSNYGLISYAASLVAFVTPIMQLGINNVLVHELVENKEKEGVIIGSTIVLRMVASVLCIVGVTAFAMVANPGDKTTVTVCLLYSTLLFFQAMDAMQFWFQAKLLSKYTSLIMLGAYLAVAAYKVMLLIMQKSVQWFALSNALDHIIIVVFLSLFYKKLGGAKLTTSAATAKELFQKGKYYIVPSMMIMVYSQVDKIMIKGMMSEKEVGFYAAAINCVTLSSFVFSAIIDSFRPVIFENRKTDRKKYRDSLSRLYSIVIYLAVLQSLTLVVFGEYAILLLYGEQYLPAVGALQIAGWYALFSHIGSVRNVWVLAENKQKYLWVLNLTGGITNVILNAVLIPVMGINGAAVATLVTQFLTNVVMTAAMSPFRESIKYMLQGIHPQTVWTFFREFLGSYGRKV